MIYESILKPILFQIDPERAHNVALASCRVAARLPLLCDAVRQIVARPNATPLSVLGLRFPNRIGLAGGMDKNGIAPFAWWACGFGFVELGTVTPRPQPGNDKPRMFRFPDENAIVNRMGFNNAGAAALGARLAEQARRGERPPFPIGVSVGKNRETPPERTAEDYAQATEMVAAEADFISINVSSPNTPGLRALQNAHDLGLLVEAVRAKALGKPVLVKVAPELGGDDLRTVLDAVLAAGAGGIIATNTLSTAVRPELPQGGLSGKPLREISRKKVAEIRKLIGDAVCLIGVGGVDDFGSARAMFDAGANLVQLYTGLVYRGPFLPGRIAAAGAIH
jgi:dihydroorotate dehydrogenase